MTSLFFRAGFGLAVLLSASSLLSADDQITPIAPQPIAPVPVPTLEDVPPAVAPHPGPADSGWAPGGDAVSGMRVGRPYYWSAPGAAPAPGGIGYDVGSPYGNGYGPGAPAAGCGCRGGGAGSFGYSNAGPGYAGFGSSYGGTPYYGGFAYGGADPYTEHFGPGFHRNSIDGHNRFPGYSYRRPWYYPGLPSYNRDTHLPW